MSYTIMMQDWTTIQTAAATVTTQTDSEWVDMSDFLDLVFYISTQNVVGSPSLALQTSPSKDNDLFQNITTIALSAGALQLPAGNLPVFRYATSTVPLARYLRWQLSAAAGYTAVFRIYVSATTQGSLIGGASVANAGRMNLRR